MHWTWSRFEELGVDNLYDALALRSRVFVLEQGPYLDPDGLDRQAWHLLGRDDAGMLVAALRVVDAGAKFDEPSIGRVVIAPEIRGQGRGRLLLHEGLQRCMVVWPDWPIRISAQTHLKAFYGEFGFVPQGESYLEDEIPHIQMLRKV